MAVPLEDSDSEPPGAPLTDLPQPRTVTPRFSKLCPALSACPPLSAHLSPHGEAVQRPVGVGGLLRGRVGGVGNGLDQGPRLVDRRQVVGVSRTLSSRSLYHPGPLPDPTRPIGSGCGAVRCTPHRPSTARDRGALSEPEKRARGHLAAALRTAAGLQCAPRLAPTSARAASLLAAARPRTRWPESSQTRSSEGRSRQG